MLYLHLRTCINNFLYDKEKRIKLVAERKRSRGYQRVFNVESDSGNKYNEQSEQRRWNKNNIPIYRNQNLDFTKELPYESPETSARLAYGVSELSAKRLPSANTRYNFCSSKWNHKIIGAEFNKQTRKKYYAKSINGYLPIY